MYFEVAISRINNFLRVFILKYKNIFSYNILYVTGGDWIIIECYFTC